MFFENHDGHCISTKLKKWEVISCPAGILHGFENEGTEDVLMQTLIGAGHPGPVGYADDKIYLEETRRLAERVQRVKVHAARGAVAP